MSSAAVLEAAAADGDADAEAAGDAEEEGLASLDAIPELAVAEHPASARAAPATAQTTTTRKTD